MLHGISALAKINLVDLLSNPYKNLLNQNQNVE
jgi:hypothetical protein